MYAKKFFQSMLVVAMLTSVLTSSPTMASPPTQGKGPGGVSVQDAPTETIENAYIKALTANGGRFIIGTTGGDPNTSDDDNKRLLYGYPSNVGSSFSTLRVVNGGTTTDYRLGDNVWDDTGVAPVAPPTSDGTTITTVWEQAGIRVEERLYFVQNSDTGRLDTAAVEYTVKNNNSSSRNVGLRVLLDVMIGDNDGAPYFVLGTGQLSQEFEFYGANVPEYWIAYESPTFDPGSLKGRGQLSGGSATRPDRFVIAHWGDDLCGGVPGLFDTDWDYIPNPSFAVTCDSATALYYNPVTLGPDQTKTYRTYYGIAESDQAVQLELTGLEVTQGIQNWENGVVLIQDRPTFVRAHVRSTSGTVSDVTAELIGRRSGSELAGSPLRPANTGGNTDVLENPNRSQLNDSFYFELPESWRSGTVEFEFRGDSHTIACREHAGTNNDCKAQVTFTESPAADVRLVGIIWRESDTKHQPTWSDIHEVVQEIESTFPIPELDWDRPYDIEPVFFAGQPSAVWQFIRLNTMLKINRTLDGCISTWPVNCTRHYLGILVDPPTSGIMGMAGDIPADVATAYFTYPTDRYFTPAHEFGHAAGRRHTTCTGNEGGPDPNYPYPNGRISSDSSGDNAFYGFDISTKRIYGPHTGDLMSYCTPNWPSDWTYTHIRDHLVSRYGTSGLSLALLTGEPAVLVSGVVTATEETGSLESVFAVESPVSASAPDPGTYTIRFEDSGGQELASYSFEPDFGMVSCVGCADNGESDVGTFALLLPWNASTARIVLLHNTQQLDSRMASNNAPTINVIYPNGGESLSSSTATLSWSASDLDSDPLEYAVQYSTDAGVSWQTLVSAWSSATYELSLDVVAGTGQGLLRVLASDGFHTSQDQSDGTFTVAKHPPQASIRTPENSSLYVGDQTIILGGSAFDNEDGQLSDTALSWSSSLDGNLGTGQSLAIVASTLTEGTHTITLTAQDGDGQTDTANITVQVCRERPTLPTTLAVAPSALSFTAVEGSGQTAWQSLSIRNSGDGTMTWSAASDQSWILVSSLEGTAPTDIIVAAHPTGLSIGEYTGSITITASGAVNSPQVVGVTLNVQPEMFSIYLPLMLRQP